MHRVRVVFVCVVVLASVWGAPSRAASEDAVSGATYASGFQETVVFSGLEQPTAVQFAADGRVFVAEKSGLVKVFDDLADPTPEIFADLRANVHSFWDRGLLGLALDPRFPEVPHVYVLYTFDAPIGGTAPTWGTLDGTEDGCPDPPGALIDGCAVSGRLSRLTASGNRMVGAEEVLVEDWCQQFPGHSIGALMFGPDGYLYAGGGDGAYWDAVDYGQFGTPPNPCGDPPSGVGGLQSVPTAEGGALRAQDARTPDDPLGYDGTILRINPANPAERQVIAYGLRNPFRFAARPGTNELWIGDVGLDSWDEIDRVADVADEVVENFGWPCYEGAEAQPLYVKVGLELCTSLYADDGAVTNPFYAYSLSREVVEGDGCPLAKAAISGLAFYRGGSYPAAYDGALFFADHARNCIWVMFPGADGLPDPTTRSLFAAGAAHPVDMQIGPGGDLFYVDFDAGTVRRVTFGPPAWARVDYPVAQGVVARTWLWGPRANTPPIAEEYAESPDGWRMVQYFDKGRLETTHPDAADDGAWYVTSGLLAVELITGRQQVGDDTFVARGPADINVAGDVEDALGPTYATFGLLLDAPPNEVGAPLLDAVARDGSVRRDPRYAVYGVTAAAYEPVTRHAIAAPFWSFMHASGLVYEQRGYVEAALFSSPYYATGYPLTEPYWATVTVAGTPRDVLVQCFERRCLTYTPGNPPGFETETGNIGQHYYAWRYAEGIRNRSLVHYADDTPAGY